MVVLGVVDKVVDVSGYAKLKCIIKKENVGYQPKELKRYEYVCLFFFGNSKDTDT